MLCWSVVVSRLRWKYLRNQGGRCSASGNELLRGHLLLRISRAANPISWHGDTHQLCCRCRLWDGFGEHTISSAARVHTVSYGLGKIFRMYHPIRIGKFWRKGVLPYLAHSTLEVISCQPYVKLPNRIQNMTLLYVCQRSCSPCFT